MANHQVEVQTACLTDNLSSLCAILSTLDKPFLCSSCYCLQLTSTMHTCTLTLADIHTQAYGSFQHVHLLHCDIVKELFAPQLDSIVEMILWKQFHSSKHRFRSFCS